MKKFLLTISLLLCVGYAANAQVDGYALGLRLGGGVELSYQHPLTSGTRLEFDLGLTGFSGKRFDLTGVYQTVYAIDPSIPGFNWYWGVGAGIGIWRDNFSVSVLGDIGLEYNLPRAPIQFSLDWRPGLYFVTGGRGLEFGWESICLGIRYKF